MPPYTPLTARAAVYQSWAETDDRSARTAPARAAFDARFENEVDPDGVLTMQARAVRAESARRAHFLRMAHKSAQARRRKTRVDLAGAA